MAFIFRRPTAHYELVPRSSNDSLADFDGLGFDRADHASWTSRLPAWLRSRSGSNPKSSSAYSRLSPSRRRRRLLLRILYWLLITLPYTLLTFILFVTILLPSYTYPPVHYDQLRARATETTSPGRANPHNEKVFIAATIYEKNGALSGGAWGEAVLDLVDLLGPENVYLSVYENDPDPVSKDALLEFGNRVTCNSSIVSEHLSFDHLPRVTLPSGEQRIKRIAFLAEVRNRALQPLERSDVAFDKLLFVNDVIFDPIEAAQLLFSTNVDSRGRAQYGAACAVDFINPFKFYDRFATRDLEGYSMGIPFYPWFTDAGSGISRQDVLNQKDAVRVRSCWGGMTAFEAKWFQKSVQPELSSTLNTTSLSPLRFRAEEATFWDSSECCLIHADLQFLRNGQDGPFETGIYMNPYVRVAYDTSTLKWLPLSRRPERLYSIIHNILNHMVSLPGYNPRRTEEPGETVIDKVWQYKEKSAMLHNATDTDLQGSYQNVQRIAGPGGFCGARKLLLINEDAKEGESKWINLPIPHPY